MNVGNVERIVQLDLHISRLLDDLTLDETEKIKVVESSRLKRQVDNFKEIRQLRAKLHYVLQGYPKPFHFHRLPLEVLEQIFKQVKDPKDKLTLIRTFPVVSQLMHWDEGTLQFQSTYELIYPLIRREPLLLLKLCQVSPSFQQTVLNEYENTISRGVPRTHFRMYQFSEEDDILELTRFLNELENIDYLQVPWIREIPCLFGVRFRASMDSFGRNQPTDQLQLQGFLDRYGGKVWKMTMQICNSEPIGGEVGNVANQALTVEEVLDIINGFLMKTPNLRHLTLTTAPGTRILEPPEENQLPQRPLPHLPNLKNLDSYLTPVLTSVLLKVYGDSLKQLLLFRKSPKNVGFNMKRLETYTFAYPRNIQNFIKNVLSDCPLKEIRITMNLALQRRTNILELLIKLSHFANTLESVAVAFSGENSEEDRVMHENRGLMLQVNLPKVNRFIIFNYFGGMDFLLSFTSLKGFSIADCKEGTGDGASFLKIPRDEGNKYKGNVWKYLSKLIYFSVSSRLTNGETRKFEISRYEYELHQKMMSRLTK